MSPVVNKYLHNYLSYVAGVNDASTKEADVHEGSRTKLDTHANMPVLGIHCYIIAQLGKTATVQPYRPDYEPMDIPLVHAAVQYDCPYSGKAYVLVIRNALYVSTMTHNLIPPFIMREAGISVNDVAKIHVENPTNMDHAVVFKDTDFKIPLSLREPFNTLNLPSHPGIPCCILMRSICLRQQDGIRTQPCIKKMRPTWWIGREIS